MTKNFKKLTALTLIYCLVFSLVEVFKMEVKASTVVPEYKKVINRYVGRVYMHKDKTILNVRDVRISPDYSIYFDGYADKEVKLYDLHGDNISGLLSEGKVYSGGGDVISLENGKVIDNIAVKMENIRNNSEIYMKNKYGDRYKSYYLGKSVKEFGNEIWGSGGFHDEDDNEKDVLSNGKTFIEFELEYSLEDYLVNDKFIYALIEGGYYTDRKWKFIKIDKNSGKIIINSEVTGENSWGGNTHLYNDYLLFRDKKYKIGDKSIEEDLTYKFNESYKLENGYVKKFVNDEYINIYAVDPKMNQLKVYDENNMIVYTNEDSNYGYTIINNKPADWKDHYANKEIKLAMDKKWVETTEKFRPNDAITRAEFIKIVNKAFGFTAKATSEKYDDIKAGDWWYNEVLIAIKAGYIDTKASNFRPNDKITREEVAAIVTSIKKNKDINLDKVKTYEDFTKVSTWAQSSVEGAIEAGYMGKGSNKFRPKDNITRAEAVVTLYRIVK